MKKNTQTNNKTGMSRLKTCVGIYSKRSVDSIVSFINMGKCNESRMVKQYKSDDLATKSFLVAPGRLCDMINRWRLAMPKFRLYSAAPSIHELFV